MRKTAANVEMQGIEFQIINDSDEAAKGLEELSKLLSRLKNSIGGSGTQLSKAADGIRQIKNAIKDTKLSSFESGMRRISDSLKPLGEMKFTSVTSFMKQINSVNPENLEKIAAIDFSNLKEAAEAAKTVSGVSGTTSRISSSTTGNSLPLLEDAGVAEMPASLMESKQGLQETKEEAERATAALRKTKEATKETSQAMRESSISSKIFSSRLKDLVKSFGRIVKYRAIRSVIAGITGSLREGIQNLARYSDALNNTDAAQANKTMSEYASTLQQVKNSIGAAVMPVLNALLPLINTIANAFITATNAINQFFSALSGKGTFTKATKNAVDYADSLDSASGAASKLKKTVAGFDELNLLNNTSSGGGGGASSGIDYSDMFEEVAINPKIQKITTWLKEDFEDILTIVKAIGSAILAWKLASKFTNDLKTLFGVAAIASGITLIVKNIKAILGGEYSNVSFKSALRSVIGGLLVGAGAVALGAAGWAIPVAIGLTFVVTSIVVNWDNTVDMWEGIWEGIKGLFSGDSEQLWGGIDDAFVSWLNMDSWTVKLQEKIVDALWGEGTWENAKKYFENNGSFESIFGSAWEWWNTNIIQPWEEFFKGIPEWWNTNVIQPIDNFVKGLWESVTGWIKGAWEDIKEFFKGIPSWIKEKVINPVFEFFDNLCSDITDFFINAWEDIKTTWKNVKKWFNNTVIEPVSEFFMGLKDDISGAFSDAWKEVKRIWESVSTWFNNNVITPIETAFSGISNLFGGKSSASVNVNAETRATGGFVDSGQLFIAREAGAEMVGSIGNRTAVANNDQIVEAVALGVYQAVSQAMSEGENNTTITLDGDVLYQVVVRKDRQHAKRVGASAFAY